MLADIDCDGRADIVLTYTEPNGYGYGSHMLAAAAYSYKTTSFSKQELLYGFWDNWWKFRQIGALDMAAGNFYMEGDPKALNGNKVEIAIACGHAYSSAKISSGTRHLQNHLTTTIYDWDATKKTFSAREYNTVNQSWTDDYNSAWRKFHRTYTSDPVNLLVDDFTKRSLVLGRPYHYVKENENTTMVVMQEPPKHVDYTLVSGTNYGVVNLSRVSSFFTNFFQSDTKSSGVSTSQTAEGATAVSMGMNIKLGYKTKVKGVGASDVNVGVEANAKKSWENKDTALKKSFENTQNSITASTTGDDYVAFNLATTDIWRYPIVGKFSAVSTDKQLYYTVTVPAPQKAMNKTGMQAIDFQPPWCNGNILSYPRTEAAVLDFIEARRIGGAAEFTVDRNAMKKDVSWTKSVSSEKTHTSAISKHGDVTVTVGLMNEVMGKYVDAKFKAGVARGDKSTESSTVTTSFSTSTGFSAVIPSTFPDALNNSNVYSITPIVYESPAKAMKVAYLANISDANLDWWTQRYAGKPDPALNLPRLWKTSGSSWVIDTDTTTNPNARMIRGFFIANYENLRVGPGIETNKPVSLYCRVHNFAMKYKGEDDGTAQGTAKNVNVRFEYQKKELGKLVGSRTQIAETTIDQIPVWNTDNLTDYNNKLAAVSWDVTAVPDGHYRVFVTVNPDKSIDELPYHGIGEACDNNEGWYDVCIAAPKEPKQASALIAAGELDAEVAGDTSADDPWFFGIGEVDLCDLDNNFDFTLDEDGVKAATEITNKGTNAALNVLVSLIDKDENVVDVQRLPGVLPGETVGVELAGNLAKNYTGDLKLVIGEVIGETNMDSNSVTKTIGGSGSGGCSAGFGALALLAIAVLPAAARRKR